MQASIHSSIHNMESNQVLLSESQEMELMVQAQSQLWNLTLGFLKSMTIRCALDLGIAEAIANHGGEPMTLDQLQSKLSLPSTKKQHLQRLLRMLAHIGFLEQNAGTAEGDEVVYGLTRMSYFALKDAAVSCFSLVRSHLEFVMVTPSLHLGDWFKRDDQQNPFEMAHDSTVWEVMNKNPSLNELFNDGMEKTNSYLVGAFVNTAGDVFEGVRSLIDVGGGTGALAIGIAKNFPHIECTVLDLPHVIHGVPNDGPVKFVSGDMFNHVPPADVVVLKWILHDWSDEDCIKILKRCKEAVANSTGGKVIVIETVVGSISSDAYLESQLLSDMLMMTVHTGAERDEHEWQKLFSDAGFGSYKMIQTIAYCSVIEIYP